MSEAPHIDLDTSAHNLDLSPPTPSQFDDSNFAPQAKMQNGTSQGQNGILDTAQNVMASAKNHPAVKSATDTVVNGETSEKPAHDTQLNFAGPVGQSVKNQSAKTRDEFADLANARTTPDQKTATGQNLTHYHSMFYRLLSWKNPRATGIAFAATVLFIFAARYLNLIRYIFKASWMTLGLTAAAEVAGQLTIGKGLTSQFRPRQYFTIPKASLERLTDDMEQLINFFVIESQRIVFAENIFVTVAAFFASLISYFLIKFVPLWGLSLIATIITFLGPLVYIQNKEVIDAQIEKGYDIANQQAQQVKELANQHAGNAVKTMQGYTQQATQKAQATVNQYRGRSTSPEVKKEAFPSVPKNDPVAESSDEEEEAVPTKPVAQPAL